MFMYTEGQIAKKIRAGHRQKLLVYILCMFFMPTAFFSASIPLFRGSISVSLPYILVMVVISSLATIFVDYFIIWKKFLEPDLKGSLENDPVFRAFKSLPNLTAAVNEAMSGDRLYQHDDFYFTYKYIVDARHPETIMRLEDIVESFVTGDTRSDGKMVVVKDCYDRMSQFSLGGDKESAMHVCKMIYKYGSRLKNKPPKDDSVVAEL